MTTFWEYPESTPSRHSPRPLWNFLLFFLTLENILVSVGIRPDLYGIKSEFFCDDLNGVSVGIRPDLYGITIERTDEKSNLQSLSRHSPRPLWNISKRMW